MKRLFITFFIIFISAVCHADTVNLKWLNDDGTTYSESTCDIGNDLIIPTTPPTKYGHTFTGWKLLPYRPIEYLESTGEQYIDTGVMQSDYYRNLIFAATFKPSDVLCGDHLASVRNDSIFYPLLIRYGYFMTNVWGGGGEKNLAPKDSNKHTIVVNLANGNIRFDNTEFSFGATSANVPTNIIIFGNNNLGDGLLKSCYKLYSLSLTTADGTFIRDFVPVIDDNGIPCLYDKVTEQFFYSSSTGGFKAGPLL